MPGGSKWFLRLFYVYTTVYTIQYRPTMNTSYFKEISGKNEYKWHFNEIRSPQRHFFNNEPAAIVLTKLGILLLTYISHIY